MIDDQRRGYLKSSADNLKINPDKKRPRQSVGLVWLIGALIISGVIVSMALKSQDRYSNKEKETDAKITAQKKESENRAISSDKEQGKTNESKDSEASVSSKTSGENKTAEQNSAAESGKTIVQGNALLTVSGYIIPRERIDLSPRFMSKVIWIGVKKGDAVKKGQELVRLDSEENDTNINETDAQLKFAKDRLRELENGTRPEEIEQAKASLRLREVELKNAESLLKRRNELLKSKSISQEEYDNALRNRDAAAAAADVERKSLALAESGPRNEVIEQAKAQVRIAEAAVERARIYKQWTTIYSPIDGVVLEKLANVGELVTPQSYGNTRGPSTALLAIADLKDLQIECELNETDISKIFISQKCRISPEAFPDRDYEGTVAEIAPEANRQKGTLQVKVQVENPDNYLTPELSAKVTFLK